jgi:putative Flp pilus-assembly TadE/G-like protein
VSAAAVRGCPCGRHRPGNGERGAILIQLALASVVLCGFCGLVIDYGVLWVARAQAQNAADAGALAGATALAFDSILDPAIAENAAVAAVAANHVWLQAPIVETPAGGGRPVTTIDTSCVVPGTPPPSGNAYNCVTVRVYRNGQLGSSKLPTFFAHLFNVLDQGVQAQAQGTAAPANSTACLWPLAIPDKWGGSPAWSATNMFLKYGAYPTLHTPGHNSYTAPTFGAPGTGFKMLEFTLGATPNLPTGLTLTRFDPAMFRPSPDLPNFSTTASQFVSVVVPRIDGGGFASNLTSCNGLPVYIGDTLALDNTGTIAQATTAASARKAQDPGATWNGSTLRIRNSCAASSPPCAMMSPRLVALPLFNVEQFEDTRRTGTPVIKIVNFVGFFINQVTGSTSIQGNLATFPGNIDTTKPQVQYLSAFLRAGVLFR